MTDYSKYTQKMDKVVNNLLNEFDSIRAGRANPSILNKVNVDYYGVVTPINQLAAISVSEARVLVIQPWDASSMNAIYKAIIASDIGITPTNDGKSIRVAFPPLTEERRKEIVKGISKHCEESKIAVRNVRRDAIEDFKKLKKNSEITEDDMKNIEKEVQNITDKYCKKIDTISKEKDEEIMEI